MKNNSKNSIQEPPNFAIMFANISFYLGILLSLLITIFAFYKSYYSSEYTSQTFYHIFIVLSGIFAILFWLGLRLNDGLKVNLSILFTSLIIPIYFVEFYLVYKNESKSQKKELQISLL